MSLEKYNIVHKKVVSSTMDEVKNYVNNTLLFADMQTAGRGKGDRVWVSEENLNLYMSLVINATEPDINYSNFSFLSSVCVVESLNNFTENLNVQTKWPNDVLINQKKVSGILLEFDLNKGILVIGIGVNLFSYPENAMFTATSVKNEGFSIERMEFINFFLERFDYYSNDLKNNGFKKIHDIWLKNSYNYKKKIIVKNNKYDNVSGVFEEFDLDGTLFLKEESGNIIKIVSGDIF